MKNTILLLILVSLLLSACGGTTPSLLEPTAVSGAPQAWVDSPLNGSSLPLGEVEIISHAASASGISQVELRVDGAIIRSDPNPGNSETLNLVRQSWRPASAGTYQVSVRAQTTGGEWSQPASVTITIMDASPTPIASATSTLVASETPTPLTSPTSTPAGPLTIVLIKNSFCRTGPGQVYREITALAAGDSAEVRGISQDTLWLFIYWPKFQVECWIVTSAAPPETNLSGIPALVAPPTPEATGIPPTAIPPTEPPTPYKP